VTSAGLSNLHCATTTTTTTTSSSRHHSSGPQGPSLNQFCLGQERQVTAGGCFMLHLRKRRPHPQMTVAPTPPLPPPPPHCHLRHTAHHCRHSAHLFGEKTKAWMMSPASRLYRRFPSARSHNMATPSCTANNIAAHNPLSVQCGRTAMVGVCTASLHHDLEIKQHTVCVSAFITLSLLGQTASSGL
jgi:hypothetical protein